MNFLKNCPLWVKLGLGFASIIVFLVVISTVTYLTMEAFADDVDELTTLSQLEKSMIEKESDHQKFMVKASAFFYEPDMKKMEVQTDYKRCALGTWLYGSGRATTEEHFSGLTSSLKSLEDHHKQLHQAIEEINDIAEGAAHKEEVIGKTKEIFDEKAQPALEEVRGDFDRIITALENRSGTVATSFANEIGKSTTRNVILTTIAIVVALAASVLITRFVSHSINNVVTVNEELANGNMTVRSSVDQGDEMGQLAEAANKLAVNIGQILKAVRGSSSTIQSSTEMLDTLAARLSTAADEVASLCNTTAAASEQMDNNMTAISAATEQTSTNISMVASAAEELTSTVSEIAKNAENARMTTTNAAEQATSASAFIADLDESAREINKVTETINEIADQTNLLALNATIEAARAGEAGKGFAVVANEIKELAKQTSEATREIQQKIDGVQESSRKTIAAIGEITQTITESSDVVSDMAAAVEEQALTTQEIAENISQASVGMQEVNENIAQATTVNRDVTRDVANVQGRANNVAAISIDVRELSTEMSSNASDLAQIVCRFVIDEERFAIGRIKAAHFGWKMKLTAVINGFQQMQSTDVPDHHQCDFGKWYDNAPADLAALPLFKEMGEHHENVHKRVAEAIDAHNGNNSELAGRKLDEFEQSRKHLFEHLDRLYLV